MTRAPIRWLFALLALSLSSPSLATDADVQRKIDAHVKAASQSMMTDPRSAAGHARDIAMLARDFGASEDRAIALATARWLGAEANIRAGNAKDAEPLLTEGLKLIADVPRPIKVRGDLLMSRAGVHRLRNTAVQALDDYQAAYKVFVATGEKRSQAIALQFIASLYGSANDSARAESYYRQAAESFDGDPLLSLSLHNNRGNVLLFAERYGPATIELEKALALAKTLGKPQLEAKVIVNLSRARIGLRDFAAADRVLARGFALMRGEESSQLNRQLLASSAALAAQRGNYALAQRQIMDSFKGLDLTTTPAELRNAHFYAHEILSRVGESQLALAHLEALKRLDDETAKVATTTGAALMAAEFDYQRQELKIAEFQKMLFGAIGVAAVLLAAALAWGLVTTRRSRNRVAAANIELGESNVALEKALKAKTEFLATTSHEIRTPLNGILGMTQVMLADPKVGAEMRDRIGIVHGAGITMRALVDDILDVAKMETGNLTVEAAPMDLCATLQDVTRMWQEQARAKGLTFRLDLADAPRWIVSDSARLRQIVFNLLSNAIKFTASGEVVLHVSAPEERLRLVVTDSGIGIPEAKFDEIFESFRQVDAGTTRQFGGTGLGLTICRNLAEALGGTICVASVEGQGSTFTIDLPLTLAEAPQDARGDGGHGGAAMLVVDRNPIARSMLRTLFEPRTGNLRFAAAMDEAVTMLGEAPATHVLIDEATLKANSDAPLETLRTLIAAAGGADSTILWARPDDRQKSDLLAAGVGKIVEKPVSGTALIAAVLPEPILEMSGKGEPALVSRAA